MGRNAQDVETGLLCCDLQSAGGEVEQVIGLITIPASAPRFPRGDIGNGEMQKPPGFEPRACRIEKRHWVCDVLEHMIHHYDVKQIVDGKRLKRTTVHGDAGAFFDSPASRGGYIAPVRTVPLQVRGGEQRSASHADLEQ